MKIAIYEPEPRICGPVVHAFQVKAGLEKLGHEVHVLSFTKSGKARSSWGTPKPGARWIGKPIDRVDKDVNATRVLDEYDMVFMPEIKCPSPDKEALKTEDIPTYVTALMNTKARWTTALHGSSYTPRETPFMEMLLTSPSRGTNLLTYSLRSLDTNDIFKTMNFVHLQPPYVPQFGMDEVPELRGPRTVGATGRFIYNKGQHIVALAGGYLPEDITVEIWGACSIGPSASPTYVVFEALVQKLGWMGKRYGHDARNALTGGNVIQPFTWDARKPGHALVRYLGNYSDPHAVASRLSVHANLTSETFSGGLIEAATMEAMDAGALCITAKNVSHPEYITRILKDYTSAPSVPKLLKNDAPMVELSEAFLECLDFMQSNPKEYMDIVRHNRQKIRELNAPEKIAQQIIDSAFS